MNQIRVVIADDHAAVRAMLRQLLDSCCRIVWEASDGWETVEAVKRFRPELLLLDVSMPRMNGFEVLRELKLLGSETHTIVVSAFSNPAYIHEAATLGAKAYVKKRAMNSELLPCIRRIFPTSGDVDLNTSSQ